MSPKQEPKYEARDGRIYNRATGESIPDDEPVFILRARDVHAISMLAHYGAAVVHGQLEHWDAVQERLNDFSRFRRDHPERMKQPDTASPDN